MFTALGTLTTVARRVSLAWRRGLTEQNPSYFPVAWTLSIQIARLSPDLRAAKQGFLNLSAHLLESQPVPSPSAWAWRQLTQGLEFLSFHPGPAHLPVHFLPRARQPVLEWELLLCPRLLHLRPVFMASNINLTGFCLLSRQKPDPCEQGLQD